MYGKEEKVSHNGVFSSIFKKQEINFEMLSYLQAKPVCDKESLKLYLPAHVFLNACIFGKCFPGSVIM